MLQLRRAATLFMLSLVSLVHVNSFFLAKGRIGLTFPSVDFIQAVPTPYTLSHGSRTELSMGASLATHKAFNPFKARQQSSSKVGWFDAELSSFYDFVENQPMLNAEQELQYGKAIAMWNKAKQLAINSTSAAAVARMSTEELAKAAGLPLETVEKMQKYEAVAMNKLVNSNLNEMISEGTKGLSKAAARYDYSKGYRFATYATWYVHQAVSEYVRWRRNPAKMPSRYLLLIRKVREFSKEYKASHGGCSPTIAEISSSLGKSHFDIIKVLNMQTFPQLMSTPVKSRTAEGRDQMLEHTIASSYEPPMIHSDQENLRRSMERMMCDSLSEVERDVLRLRLGFDDGRVKPMKEVGKKFQISWKQVRSVEKGALGKLLEHENFSDLGASSVEENKDIAAIVG